MFGLNSDDDYTLFQFPIPPKGMIAAIYQQELKFTSEKFENRMKDLYNMGEISEKELQRRMDFIAKQQDAKFEQYFPNDWMAKIPPPPKLNVLQNTTLNQLYNRPKQELPVLNGVIRKRTQPRHMLQRKTTSESDDDVQIIGEFSNTNSKAKKEYQYGRIANSSVLKQQNHMGVVNNNKRKLPPLHESLPKQQKIGEFEDLEVCYAKGPAFNHPMQQVPSSQHLVKPTPKPALTPEEEAEEKRFEELFAFIEKKRAADMEAKKLEDKLILGRF